MRTRLPLVATTLAVAAALLTTACAPQAKLKAVPAGVTSGGHLTVGILAPRSIAPWLTSTLDPAGSLVVATMCDQVLGRDPVTAELTPALAAAWRYQKPDDLLVRLRKGLVFPDGSKVTAGDVADSLSRAARSELGSPVADAVKLVGGWDLLQGLPSAKKSKQRYRERLSGISRPDPTSVEIHLSKARPDAFHFLAHPLASVVPSKAYAADPAAMERRPVCVGPYQLDAPWQPGTTSIRLSRSSHYKPSASALVGGGRGLFDSIEFRILADPAALLHAYTTGAVDVAMLPGATPAQLQAVGPDALRTASPTVHYIGLPNTKAPFDNPVVRVALSVALDRKALAAAVPGLRPLGRFLPPTLGKPYADDSKVACRGTAPLSGGLPYAKALLARKHLNLSGRTFRIAFNDEYDNRALVQAVAKQWEAGLGLQVQLAPIAWNHLLDQATGQNALAEPFRLSWRPETSDPFGYLEPLFSTNAIGDTNWSHASLIPFDHQIDKTAAKQLEPADRALSLLEAENMLCVTMPMIPVAEGTLSYAVRGSRIGSAGARATDLGTGTLLLREMYSKPAA
jgi:ABC-type oligopeptide transport system substrate-binding subunit